ncbi:hypothetical protein HYV81_01320 [Candidatus Woesearchaeota archaeon]|nr:hypothetical protein [Candidatus Woesearchaeota archaeon]
MAAHKKARKVKERTNLIAWFYSTAFMRSLDLDRRYFIVLAMDILLIIGLLLTAGIFKQLLNSYAEQANVALPKAITVFQFMNDPRIQATPEVISELYDGVYLLGAALSSFLRKTVATIAVMFTFAVFLVSLIKGYAWAKIKRTDFSRLYFKRFLAINFMWFWAAILTFFGCLYFLRSPLDVLSAQLWVIAFLYLLMVMHASYTEARSAWGNTKHALHTAIFRFYRFMPAVFFFTFFMIIIVLFSGVLFSISAQLAIYLSLDAALLILLLLFIMETAWIKFYYYEAYRKFKDSHHG